MVVRNDASDGAGRYSPSLVLILPGILTFLAAVLALSSLAMALGWWEVLHENRMLWAVSDEANIWTWTTVMGLALASVAHLATAYCRWWRRGVLVAHWMVTGAIMMALSLDDAAALHERVLGHYGGQMGGGSGLLHFAWVIPGTMVAVVIVALFAILLRHLDGPTRTLMIAGLATFFFGAIGIEAISGAVFDAGGHSRLYVMIFHIEEFVEAVGAALLLAAGLSDLPPRLTRLDYWFARPDVGG